jgi:hypothetical protein
MKTLTLVSGNMKKLDTVSTGGRERFVLEANSVLKLEDGTEIEVVGKGVLLYGRKPVKQIDPAEEQARQTATSPKTKGARVKPTPATVNVSAAGVAPVQSSADARIDALDAKLNKLLAALGA